MRCFAACRAWAAMARSIDLPFPTTCGYGRSLGELADLAAHLLREPEFYEQTVAQSQQLARERLSFEIVACKLRKFFASL